MENERILQPGIIYEDNIIKYGKRTTEYDLISREYGIGITPKNDFFYFDKEDFDKIKDYSWRLNGDNYIEGCHSGPRLHRVIMGLSNPKEEVDHINHDTVDNRKSNLRVCTHSQNSMNKGIRKDNTTGYKGVTQNRWSKKYEVQIKGLDGKRRWIGSFDTLEEAGQAYLEAAKKYQGEFMYKNL